MERNEGYYFEVSLDDSSENRGTIVLISRTNFIAGRIRANWLYLADERVFYQLPTIYEGNKLAVAITQAGIDASPSHLMPLF